MPRARQRQVPFALSRGNARRDARRADRALRHAATYPHPAARVVRIETHLSVVYLAGRYAYKVFKPVKFGFVDLTRLARRRRCAQAECTLNRALAGPLYLGVWPLVARGWRGGAFGPALPAHEVARGTLAAAYEAARGTRAAAPEYAVRLRRFDAGAMLSARCARHDDGLADADALAARWRRASRTITCTRPGARTRKRCSKAATRRSSTRSSCASETARRSSRSRVVRGFRS